MLVAENLVKHLTRVVLKGLKHRDFYFSQISNLGKLERIIDCKFPKIAFDDAVKLLEDNGYNKLIEYRKYGRILTSKAENTITKLVSDDKLPVWVTNYDRDVVAFYQKPDAKDNTKVLNADLLAPPLAKSGFGGEILGLGQRQNKPDDMIESMRRQHIRDLGRYGWYIKLRRNHKYQTTSGFGMGIERYISWILGLNSLADSCLYPVLRGTKTVY